MWYARPVPRVQVQRFTTIDEDWIEMTVYRVVEENGERCDCWLPGLEVPDPDGDLDRLGFDSRSDAAAFALGVDWIRAEAGLLPGVTTADIDRERAELDQRHKPVQTLAPEPPAPAPAVEYRRRRMA